jgi:hypothetical protein
MYLHNMAEFSLWQGNSLSAWLWWSATPQQAHTDAQTNLGTFLYKSIPFSQLPTVFWGLLVPAVEQTAI